MEVLFHPDRVRNPMERKGSRGQNKWQDQEWDQVVPKLAGRLKAMKTASNGHKVAMLNGDSSPLMRSLCHHFMDRMDSPNYFEVESLWGNSVPVQLSQGLDVSPTYDLANSRYILNFSNNFLEEGSSPVYYQQLLAQFHQDKTSPRPELIHIDSRLNLTAAKADRWVPIRPGTQGALALGIAYVLIIDNLYDKNFVAQQCTGFKSFRDARGKEQMGFEAYVRANYYPEKVARITGVPVDTIIQLSDEFGTRGPAIAITDDMTHSTSNESFNQWAVYCLNALIGNLQKKGGVLLPPPPPAFPFPGTPADSKPQQPVWPNPTEASVGPARPFGSTSFDQWAEAVAEREAGFIDTLIIIDANPLFHSAKKEVINQAFKRISSIIYLGVFIDETASQADLILPDHTFMEKADIGGPAPGVPLLHIGLQQPVVEPLFNTRQTGDVILDLGRLISGTSSFPYQNYAVLVEKYFEIIYNTREGAVISESADVEWLSYLRERGWLFQQYVTFKSFMDLLRTNGGWWNPIAPERSRRELYQNRSGKLELVSSTLQNRFTELMSKEPGDSGAEKEDQLLQRLQIEARGSILPMPHHEDPITEGNSEQYPLVLTTSQLLTNRDGRGASQASLMEMVGVQVGHYWDSWVEINPDTAREYGIKDREPVWVQSVRGRVKTRARLYQGIRPEVVHLHLGLGHSSYTRFGTGVGVNAMDLMDHVNDQLTGRQTSNGTRVKISRTSGGAEDA
jgi:anaerobic selenocysteine-containing dehydrogenase